MDWASYKKLADTPGIWSRWMLEQTLELLQHPKLLAQSKVDPNADYQGLVLQLQACLAQSPISKPPGYKGGCGLDMFRLQLEPMDTQVLLALVRQAIEMDVTTSGTIERGLGGFVAAWQEYLGSLTAHN